MSKAVKFFFFVEAIIHSALHSTVSLKNISEQVNSVTTSPIWILLNSDQQLDSMTVSVRCSLPVSEWYLRMGFQCSALPRSSQMGCNYRTSLRRSVSKWLLIILLAHQDCQGRDCITNQCRFSISLQVVFVLSDKHKPRRYAFRRSSVFEHISFSIDNFERNQCIWVQHRLCNDHRKCLHTHCTQ
jgi:hypothetical protein